MKWYVIVAAIFAGLALMGLAGCYGPSPGLNPALTFTFPDKTTLPYLGSGGKLTIKGEANPPITADNPVVYAEWSQSPAIGKFLFTGDLTLNNIWQAPAVTAPTNVTLTLKMKSLLGGESEVHLNLIIVPDMPAYVFDAARMTAEVPGFPNQIKSGTPVTMRGSGEFGVASDPVTNYDWSAQAQSASATNVGFFTPTNTENPVWTAPTLATGDQPVQIDLTVQMRTQSGIPGQSTLSVTVVPDTAN